MTNLKNESTLSFIWRPFTLYQLPAGVCPFTTFIYLYTNECQYDYEGMHIIKFVDDSVIVFLLDDDSNQ